MSRKPGGGQATALAFFGPILMLIQLAECGGDGDHGAEERARALLTAHVRHFRSTHLRRPIADDGTEAPA